MHGCSLAPKCLPIAACVGMLQVMVWSGISNGYSMTPKRPHDDGILRVRAPATHSTPFPPAACLPCLLLPGSR